MSKELIDEAYALSQRLFALWMSHLYCDDAERINRVFRRAATRALRRMGEA